MKPFSLLCVLVFQVLALPALAWGPAGHRIVGEIAQPYLTPQAQAAVAEILGEKTLADVATWADEIKDQRPETSPWHYINAPADARRVTMRDSPDEGSVLSCIVEQSRVLRDRRATAVQRAEALRFVVHMVGDVHQPMHVSLKEDLGGNTIDVWINGEKTNLHAAWDSGIVKLRDRTWPQQAEQLGRELTDAHVKRWSRPLDPAAWATESWELSRGFAYKIPADGKLTDAYLDQAQNILDERLKQAGVRLAALLNAAFD